MTRRTRVNWMILYAVLLHMAWGIILLFGDAPLHTTPLGNFPVQNHYAAGLVCLLVGGGAVAAMHRRFDRDWRGIVLVLPQQAMMMLSAATALQCVMDGMYFDGVARPRLFILSDQLPSMLAMLIHTAALVDWYTFARRAEVTA